MAARAWSVTQGLPVPLWSTTRSSRAGGHGSASDAPFGVLAQFTERDAGASTAVVVPVTAVFSYEAENFSTASTPQALATVSPQDPRRWRASAPLMSRGTSCCH